MRVLSVLQGMVENEGRMVIRVGEWFLWMRAEIGRSKVKSPTLSKPESMGHPKHA
jgi:hypothetical protein